MKRSSRLAVGLLIVLSAAAQAANFNIPVGSLVQINTGNLYVPGSVTIGGNLGATTGTISLTGDWNKTGTFNPGLGSVVLAGATQNILGKTTFYNLTGQVAGQRLKFEAGKTQVVTGRLKFAGASGSPVILRSTIPANRWKIDPRGPRNVSYVDVKDANNINAAALLALNSVDSGNNVNWLFGEATTTTTTITTTSTTTTTTITTTSTTTTTIPGGNFVMITPPPSVLSPGAILKMTVVTQKSGKLWLYIFKLGLGMQASPTPIMTVSVDATAGTPVDLIWLLNSASNEKAAPGIYKYLIYDDGMRLLASGNFRIED